MNLKDKLTNTDLNKLKKKANQLKSQFIIGKNGITTNFIKEIDQYLEANTLVKIKDKFSENKEIRNKNFTKLVDQLNAIEINRKGFTITLFRENINHNE